MINRNIFLFIFLSFIDIQSQLQFIIRIPIQNIHFKFLTGAKHYFSSSFSTISAIYTTSPCGDCKYNVVTTRIVLKLMKYIKIN